MRSIHGAMLLSVGLLAPALSGCATDGGGDEPQFSHAGREAMTRGAPCYFRGEVDFCAQQPDPDSDGDGVKDRLDSCPGTPKGVQVDGQGCPVDSDGDGVFDDRDQCPDTPKGAGVNEVGCWVLENLLFDFNQDRLPEASYPLLSEVVRVLNHNGQVRVEIHGHADHIGTPEYNEKLSMRRARAVMRHLIRHGIAADRLVATGFGPTRPVDTNDNEAGRAKNRRVELKPIL
ncbi:MAG: OmpA family protein [Magnetococcales bacterium]|nr:OmpA family protein [Magnetococcales bacterium]